MKNLKISLLKITLALLSLIVLLLYVGTTAQDQKETEKQIRTLTGCLHRTIDADKFRILAQDGSKWILTSDTVKLDDHVGHTITVVGVVANQIALGMKEVQGAAAVEAGNLRVTSLKMISEACR